MVKAVLLLLLAVFFSCSHQQCFTDDDFVPYIGPDKYACWVESGHGFSAALFKSIDKERNQPNTIISPWGIQEVFLLAYFGAQTITEESFAKFLHIPRHQDKPLTWRFYSKLRDFVTRGDEKSNPLKSASKIFLSDQLFLRTCIEEKFQRELELIDFQTNVNRTKNYINDWVANRTDGQINDLIEDLSSDSTALLVNAVFYKAKWLSAFNPNITVNQPFHVKYNVHRTTQMMRKEDLHLYGYHESLRARMLMLPYADNTSAMIFLLPDSDLDSMIQSLNAGNLGYITDKRNYMSDTLQVVIPKYKHKTKQNLNSVLEKLGIGDALTRNADFSGFTGRKEVFFDEVVHEATIEVDEEGTTAAAATGTSSRQSISSPLDFRCNRPFAYIVYDFALSKVLFMGAFREPSPIYE